jgi:TonB family protein
MDRASESSGGAPKRSRKWSIFGLFGSGILLAAGGGWYWYSQQATSVSANGNTAPAQNNFAVSTPANSPADNNFPAAEPVNPALVLDRASTAQNRNLATPPVAPATNHAAAASANNASKTFAPLENAAQQALAGAEPAAEPVKKPTFGAVHLAAPVLNHRSATDNNSTADVAPSLGSNTISPGDAGGLNLLASKGSQPAAPVPVGGDVKQARLISSVPPMYPTLARNQRLSGNVVIDALIDATGRVSTMKVISGPALLHQSAMDAVRQWKYQPATLNGQPMAMHLTVTVQFKLQ